MNHKKQSAVNYSRNKTLAMSAAALLAVFAIFLAAVSAHASVEKVEGGIKFVYYDPDAGTVFLAGTFNNWNATATPMKRDDKGYWSVVMKLSPGKHEYKFVVDGAWITDLENPNTKPDPYGGVNSVVEIDNKGDIVQRGAVKRLSNTPLNARVLIGGRYLARMITEKNVEDDPRWRMQRPRHKVDLNFNITISDMVHGYTRMRFDSGRNLFQPNNISAYLDEAHIEISPGPFDILGYYNEEVLQSKDPLSFFGDVDLQGTIFDDHLKEGKGTAGAVITSQRYGLDFQGILANVHDYDIYNNPDLFDNTGTDLYGFTLSRKFKLITTGADFFMRRNMWWLDFTKRTGSTPANTGIPRLDKHIDKTGDTSDWFNFDDKTYYVGADFTMHLMNDRLRPQFEFLRGKKQQGFVTSNRSGIDLGNGPIDVPILDRDAQIIFGRIEEKYSENLYFRVDHTRYSITNASDDESEIVPNFAMADSANKHIFCAIVSDPPTSTYDHSELSIKWSNEHIDLLLFIQRDMYKYHYPYENTDTWKYERSIAPGVNWDINDRFNIEIHQCYRSFDGSGSLSEKGSSIETISRGTAKITKNLSTIFDIRTIYIKNDRAAGSSQSNTFTSPFAGFKYEPNRKVSVVLAYGLDPVNFDIDYYGRQTARYDYRNQYLWENPDATMTDAEKALANRKMITLRATFRF